MFYKLGSKTWIELFEGLKTQNGFIHLIYFASSYKAKKNGFNVLQAKKAQKT